jgi:hypothetical protein
VVERDRRHGAGATTWYFPDGDRPPTSSGPIEAHESLMILNVSHRTANVEIDLYWTDKEPTLAIEVEVPAERVRCLRVPWFDHPADAERVEVPTRTQYAMRVRSDIPVFSSTAVWKLYRAMPCTRRWASSTHATQ